MEARKGFEKNRVVNHLKGCRKVKLRAEERLKNFPNSRSVVALLETAQWSCSPLCSDVG